MEHISQQLEYVFRRIQQERMQDMPICNPALEVQAIGFKEWGNYYLGVMVTPWFMNLMLLPAGPDVFANMKEGSKQMHSFPSGSYEFITGKETDLGDHQLCSLFSPMQEFADQETAVQTANLILSELMEVRNRDTQLMIGESDITSDITEKQLGEPKPAEKAQDPNTPMSRRDFLRGGRPRSVSRGREDHLGD
jgi:[NiFe] hydrogenase assembly HybE family chaperone